MRTTTTAWIAIAVTCLSVSSARAQTQEELVDYIVQPGDTCAKIAAKVFGVKRGWDLIHKYNKNMGPLPHNLIPGRVLKLPRAGATPDAKLTDVRRIVQTREPKKADWNRAKRGKDLFRGWRVNTLDRSAAEITFRDASIVQMRQNTLVIIYGGDTRAARRRTSHATLERGALRSRLGELRMQVSTPTAEAELQGGASVIAVDEAETSRVSNHEGGAAKVRVLGGKVAVKVDPGFGSKVNKGDKRPSKPRPLPPTPAWSSEDDRVFSGVASQGGSIDGTWLASDLAEKYRVEITRGQRGEQIIAALTVPKSITQFEVHKLPAGEYFARVSALDDDWFESKPSAALKMVVGLVSVKLPGASTDDTPELDPTGDTQAKPETVKVFTGTKLVAPEGLLCGATGEASPRKITTVSQPGTLTFVCKDKEGHTTPPVTVEVFEPELDFDEVPSELTRGEVVQSFVKVKSELPLPEDARFVATPGVEVQSAAAPGGYQVTVAAAEDAPDNVALDLVAGSGNDVTVLKSTAFEVGDPAPPEPSGLTYAPNEALGLALSPNVIGLRNDRREGSGAWMTVSHNGDGPAGDGYWRSTIGLEIAPVRELRLGMAHAMDVATRGTVPEARGDRDLYAWAGWRAVDSSDWSAYLELAAWFPTSDEFESVEKVRLLPSLELSRAVGARLLLRTRQGAIASMGKGLHAWASAYGVDFRIVGPLAIAAEVDATLGSFRADLVTGLGVGGGLSLLLSPISLYAMARYGATDDFESMVGRLTLSFGLRASFN